MYEKARVLMLSSSRKGTEAYLEHAKSMISNHLKDCRNVLFIPYAGVTMPWSEYTKKVQEALPEYSISGIHEADDPIQAVRQAEAIMIGGGNTFNMLNELYQNALLPEIQSKVAQGVPYIGWSAGSNVCGLSIKTTNDMPIVEPPSFDSLSFVSAQLNPHYTNYVPPGHNGETRDQRIAEFCVLNPDTAVIGIQEGSALLLENNSLRLIGPLNGTLFLGKEKSDITQETDLSQFL
jgi:dipeptidase E